MPAQAKVLVIKVLVDHTSHALLAVIACLLCTVIPDRLLILHDDLEDIAGLAALSAKVETGEEGVAVIEGLAGLPEAGLGDGVVLGEEVPFDNVTDLSDNVVGVEAETAEASDDGVSDAGVVVGAGDFAGGCGCGCGDGGGSEGEDGEEAERMHLGCFKVEMEMLMIRWYEDAGIVDCMLVMLVVVVMVVLMC